jgi:hypothetical protein
MKRIAVLGFAFKADTGDTRESASITLIRDFQSENALVSVYDPQVEESQIWMDLSEASPHLSYERSKCGVFGWYLHRSTFFHSQASGHALSYGGGSLQRC